jgi:autotransporter adhesin
VSSLQNQINVNQTEARAGIALAMASSGLQYDTRPGKVSVAAGASAFKGQTALASGIGYAMSDRWRFNASFTATPQVNYYGATVGASWTLN